LKIIKAFEIHDILTLAFVDIDMVVVLFWILLIWSAKLKPDNGMKTK